MNREEKFNGMVQLCTKQDTQKHLITFAPEGFKCTLKDAQKGHHVTLGYKPSMGSLDYLRKLYNDPSVRGRVFFSPKFIRWDKEICALFGYLKVGGQQTGGFVHITLAGSIPPVNSARLEHKWDGEETALGDFELVYNEVSFEEPLCER